MWTCPKCEEVNEDRWDCCWKCRTPKRAAQTGVLPPVAAGEGAKPWRLAYKYFRGTLATWDDLFADAARFATEVGPENILTISHSEDHNNGVVTVWYWTQKEEASNA